MKALYQVVQNYDKKQHGKQHPQRILKCLKSFQEGDIFEPKNYAKSHMNDFCREGTISKRGTEATVTQAIKIGKEIGILRKVESDSISIEDFNNLETVSYFASQLRSGKLKNIKSDKPTSTQQSYVRNLWYFNNWLHGKTIEFYRTIQIDIDTFKRERNQITLEGVEHFLKLFEESNNSDSDFIKVIKRYFADESNKKYSSNYMASKHSAIMSYFEKNDSPIKFHYDPNVNHHDTSKENYDATLSLADLHKILSKANPLEKAVTLCKFHRGLDSTTFADRFNFQAWEQLVNWFGHNDYENWDLSKCPVPIRVTRIKTDYNHTGFLERDAIIVIQEYLNYRYSKYTSECRKMKLDEGFIKSKNEIMKFREPIFMNRHNVPITINWLHRLIPRLAVQSGVQKILHSSSVKTKHEKTSHELRDLLKSTLIVSGCADYVCDLAIGHKVKDSYEKQDKLYPENSRKEFAKASSKINIYSNVSNYLENGDDIEQVKEQIRLETEQKMQERMERMFDEKFSALKQERIQKDSVMKEFEERITIQQNNAHQKVVELKADPERMAKLQAVLKLTNNEQILEVIKDI
jgi:hypothetical protein